MENKPHNKQVKNAHCHSLPTPLPMAGNACTHCTTLSDHDVEKLRYKEEHKGDVNLGRIFIYIAILLVIGIAII